MSPAAAMRRMSEAGEVAGFYRALGTTFSSGLPLSQGLELLSSREHTRAARERAGRLHEAISRGGALADGARDAPFIALEHALLELGEQSGSLVASMEALARFFEADHRLALKIKSRAVQPMITLLAGCFILPLPLLVRSGASAYFYAVVPAAAVALLSSGLVMSATFAALRGRPRHAIARMLWALAIALEAGLTIDRAVRLAAAALGPCDTSRRLLQVPTATWQSLPLSQTLPAVWQLPHVALMTLQTMERTGDTTSTLRWLAEKYEDGTFDAG